MSKKINIEIKVDDASIHFENNALALKISNETVNGIPNGLFIDSEGRLAAKRGAKGDSGAAGGATNISGNGIGPIGAGDNDPLITVGFNSSVSRHKKYTDTDIFLKNNDGPVMTKMNGNTLVDKGSIASYMIARHNNK